MRSHQASLARLALIAAVPASAVAAEAAVSARLGSGAYLAIVLALAMAAAVLGPVALDGMSRVVAALVALGAGAILWLGGILWVILAIASVCTNAHGIVLLTLAVASGVYIPAAVFALRSPRRAIWGWPLAVTLAMAASFAVLLLTTGGAQSCTT
jgi:hypothetical protein